jgi:hypothetical protein
LQAAPFLSGEAREVSQFDKDGWEANRALVLKTLDKAAEDLEKQGDDIASIRSDIRLLNYKMMLIGFVTGLVTSAAVSAIVSTLVMGKITK